MNILVLGSGGREHTIAWKLAQSPKCDQLFMAPGNAGTLQLGENVPINVNDFDAIQDLITRNNIKMVVVGPEDPLVNGIRDFLESNVQNKDLLIIGPGKKGAELEGSKDFCKAFLQKHNIPTAAAQTFGKGQTSEAIEYLDTLNPPFVLKADGLAAGKGVIITDSKEDAGKSLTEMMEEGKFGSAGEKVLIEEFLQGIELSVFVLTDGKDYVILPEAKDYKRIGEGDTGPNTGGMGSISPVSFANKSFMKKVEETIVIPTIKGLQTDEIPYCGFIFIGLMKVGDDPYVIEYNVRMGDPETQSVFPRIKSDTVDLFSAAASGSLGEYQLEISDDTATSVVVVSGGYPGSYEKGNRITGLENVKNSIVFHAGTKRQGNETLTNGGRVLAVTSMSGSLEQSLEATYSEVEKIDWKDRFYRKDIGQDLLSL